MASIYFNPLTPGMFGRVVLRRYGNKMVFSRPPRERKGPGVAGNVLCFREAAAYSKAIFRHPARRAPYEAEAAQLKQPVWPTIMAHFMKRPVIRAVELADYHGRVGDRIVVHTRAGLDINEVQVALEWSHREPIEQGPAVRDADAFHYVATRELPPGSQLLMHITVRDSDGLGLTREMAVTVV